MDLKNKVIWITGASSGIGEALAYACAKDGAKLVLSARRENELKRVAASCNIDPKNILILPLDLENTTSVDAKVELVTATFGRIDVLINNSGMGHRTKAVNTSTEIDRKVMEVNFFGTINLTKAVARKMQQQKSGKIAVISSIMGKYGLPLYSTYSASKHALYGYFESLRQELYNDNVKVLIVSPGFINTDVSTKLLTEDGKEYGVKSDSQNKGMSPAACANGIVKAIKSNRDHKFVGGYEIFSVYVKQYFPGIFYKLMRRMTKE
ncbi:MAG: Short-chain dehydrogenase [Bacteroidetes bacterium]|nr:Short-chain dehydrogenase [Bacteroidota bacterium]